MAAMSVKEMPIDNYHLLSDFQVMPTFTNSHNLQLIWRWNSLTRAETLLHGVKILYYSAGDSVISERTGSSQPTQQSYILKDLKPNTQYLVCLRVTRQRIGYLRESERKSNQPNDHNLLIGRELGKRTELAKALQLQEPYVAEMQCDLATTRTTYFPALLSSLLGILLAFIVTLLLCTVLKRRQSKSTRSKTKRRKSHCLHNPSVCPNERAQNVPYISKSSNSGSSRNHSDKMSPTSACGICVTSSSSFNVSVLPTKCSLLDGNNEAHPRGSGMGISKTGSADVPRASHDSNIGHARLRLKKSESKQSIEPCTDNCDRLCPYHKQAVHPKRGTKRTVSFLVSESTHDVSPNPTELSDEAINKTHLKTPNEHHGSQLTKSSNGLAATKLNQPGSNAVDDVLNDFLNTSTKATAVVQDSSETPITDISPISLSDEPESRCVCNELEVGSSEKSMSTYTVGSSGTTPATSVPVHPLSSPDLQLIRTGSREETAPSSPMVSTEQEKTAVSSAYLSSPTRGEETSLSHIANDDSAYSSKDRTGAFFYAQLTETL